ncbi:MAG: hypothetical protein JKY34_02985 [Kordiimonadaceae bacterium]|nr:hypothetical protein [Kordiimonadaceae bacterium]
MTETAKIENTEAANNLPTHVAKTRTGYGKNVSFDQIGVAWQNDDGSFYIKLYGTQVISNFTLYAIKPKEEQAAA